VLTGQHRYQRVPGQGKPKGRGGLGTKKKQKWEGEKNAAREKDATDTGRKRSALIRKQNHRGGGWNAGKTKKLKLSQGAAREKITTFN